MAVWAPELTRESAFDAIRSRRTYGSTGSRIYLEFTVNGEPMGGETTIADGQPVAVRVEALGTGPLRWIHVHPRRPRPTGLRVSVSSARNGSPAAARPSTSAWTGPTTRRPLALSTTCAYASATSSTAASPKPGAVPYG